MVTSLFAAEHEALRDAARRWVEREVAPHAAAWEAAHAYPRELLSAAGAQGWFALALPEADGGDPLASLVVAEELGRIRSGGLVQDLLAQAHTAATLVSAAPGSATADAALAGELAAGTALGQFTATPDGDGFTVSGDAPHVANAAWAEGVLVAAPADEPSQLFWVEAKTPGWSTAPPSAPFGRRAGQLAGVRLDSVRVNADALLCQGEDAARLLRERQARWRLDGAAAAVSGAWQTWEDTKAYALQREAFGRPIGKFQVNRHALADMAAELSAARALVYETVRRLTRGELGPGDTAALRLYVDRVVADAADRCLQLHGGYGYTMEFDVQRAWRDARHLRVDEAGGEQLRVEAASAMEANAR